MEGRTDFKQTAYQFENFVIRACTFYRKKPPTKPTEERKTRKKKTGKNNTSTKHKLQ